MAGEKDKGFQKEPELGLEELTNQASALMEEFKGIFPSAIDSTPNSSFMLRENVNAIFEAKYLALVGSKESCLVYRFPINGKALTDRKERVVIIAPASGSVTPRIEYERFRRNPIDDRLDMHINTETAIEKVRGFLDNSRKEI